MSPPSAYYLTTLEYLPRSILHNEEHYPDPFVFRPERFLADGQLDETVLDPDVVAFGFGRR